MDPEKKKKLEELKRKRKLLQEQLHQSEKRNAKENKSVEEEAREALSSAAKIKTNVESDELINKTQNNILKYIQSMRVQELETTKFYEHFPAFRPEVYEESTQWSDLIKEEDEEDSSSEDKDQVQEKPKQPLVVKKNKQVTNEENQEEQKEFTVTPEDEAEKYRNAHKEEINDFLKNGKKYMERAINENEIYDMFLK